MIRNWHADGSPAFAGHPNRFPRWNREVVVNSAGAFSWQQGDLNIGSPTTTMAYGQTCHHGDWTINADESGTKFVNDGTGHGMFVSIDNVYSF
jgi:hypothetical protein